MYTPQDIEVFVLTHKRPEFLKDTLDGYLQQTVKGFRLAVFSNGHSPETKQLLQKYASTGVEDFYVDEELTGVGNFARALKHVSRRILIMAHDDDFIHPHYVETILALYNKYPKLAVILSGGPKKMRPDVWKSPLVQTAYYLPTQNELAGYIYSGGAFAFSSACYKTEFVKKADPYAGKQYGKVDDVPFMVNTCAQGAAAVTVFPFIRPRFHAGQDSYNYATGPTAQQWFNLSLFFKKFLDTPAFPRLRMLFLLQNYRHIRIGWKDWCKCEYSKMSFKQFREQAVACGALTWTNIWIGCMLRGKFNRWLQQKIAGFKLIVS